MREIATTVPQCFAERAQTLSGVQSAQLLLDAARRARTFAGRLRPNSDCRFLRGSRLGLAKSDSG